MEPGITWYEVLGVLPGADPERIRRRYDELTGVRRRGGGLTPAGTFGSGSWAGSGDLGIAAELGADVLGGLLELGDFSGPRPRPPRRVPVPDIRGLFYDVCLEVVGRLGLKVRSVQVTPHPMPVDGLVIDQSPKAPGQLRRHETVTARVWHPPVRWPAPFQGPGR